MINSINNNISFKGVNLYYIPNNSKQGKLISKALQDTSIAPQIKTLEEHSLDLDLIRDFNPDLKGKKVINVKVGHKNYLEKLKLKTLQGASGEIKTLEDAKKLILQGIEQAMKLLVKK